jgi:hypothetical protein
MDGDFDFSMLSKAAPFGGEQGRYREKGSIISSGRRSIRIPLG